MVPDLVQPTDEIRALCIRVVLGLDDVGAIIMIRWLPTKHAIHKPNIRYLRHFILWRTSRFRPTLTSSAMRFGEADVGQSAY